MGFTDALWLAKSLFNYDLLGVLPQDRHLSVDSDCAGCGQGFFLLKILAKNSHCRYSRTSDTSVYEYKVAIAMKM